MKYLKASSIVLLSIIISSLIFSSFSYIELISENTKNILIDICTFITIFIISYKLTKNSKFKKNYNGLIEGLILVISFLLIRIILRNKINIFKLIFYLIIIIISFISNILAIKK